MFWKFWRWGRKKTAANDTQETEAGQSAVPAPAAQVWPSASGVREILALHQLVGNQAVLAMLARRAVAPSARDHGS